MFFPPLGTLRPLINTCQCLTSQPITSSVHWRTEVFKIKGFVRKRFLRSPPPPPPSYFLLSPHFSRWQNAEHLVLRTLLHGNACYAGYLDSQSKIQMFTLFSGRHIGVPRRYTNRALSDWALEISSKQFDEYLKFGETHRPKTWRSVLIILSSIISQFLSFSHWMVFDLLFCIA